MELQDCRIGPGIVIGAGYGIAEAIQDIAESGKCVTLIATDKAFPLCPNADFVVSLNTEATKDVKLSDWYFFASKANSLILPVTAHPSHVREWYGRGGGEIYWMVPANIHEDLSLLWEQKYRIPAVPRGANSGEFGFLMAFIVGCDPIGLTGMPYAFKSLPETLSWQSPTDYEYHHFVSDGKHCFTTLPFMEQRTEFLELVELTGHKNVFNISEGGILYDNKLVKRTSMRDFLEMCK